MVRTLRMHVQSVCQSPVERMRCQSVTSPRDAFVVRGLYMMYTEFSNGFQRSLERQTDCQVTRGRVGDHPYLEQMQLA